MLRSKPIQTAAVLLLAAGMNAAQAAGGPPGADRPLPPIPEREQREMIRKGEGGDRRLDTARAAEPEMLTPGAPVDVEHYLIDMEVTLLPKRVSGTVHIQARSLQDGLSSLQVDLYDEMNATSVTAGATPLLFSHLNDRVQITLDRPYDDGELIDIAITYGGLPPNPGFGSFTFQTHGPGQGSPIVSSLSEPTYAPTWWPCLDDPADKAIVDMNLTVPAPLIGVSNGLLVSAVSNPDSTITYEWRSSYPISTYLVSVAISNYQTWTDWYVPVTGGPAMPVQNWVYPEHFSNALEDLNVTVPMLEFFSTLFGEYPFVTEKYGHTIFPYGGAMEHQTNTSYGAILIRGDHFFDWVVAHELGHQWFGDMVSPSAWPEIWLNEGGATYSEALWREHLGGPPALQAWMASLDSRPFCGTLYDPAASGCNLFGNTVYDKGGWVLHMLRRVVGDTAFFQGLRDYFGSHAYANASTADLQAAMEGASGLALGPFFSRWVFGQGEPTYLWGWSAVQTLAGWITYVHVEQTQPGAPFSMPIDIVVSGPPGNTRTTHVVQNSMTAQDFALPPRASAPTDVNFDPDGWILKTATEIVLPDGDADGVPDTADNCGMLVNPEQNDSDGDLAGDGCDCAPLDPAFQLSPPEVDGLVVTGGSTAALGWDAVPGGGPGLTYDLLRAELSAVRDLPGLGSLSCYVSGLLSPGGNDDDAIAPGDGFIYFVRAFDGCVGTLGTAPGAPARPSPSCP